MLNEQDLVYHKGLMKILDEATFPLKAREVASFAKIYNWVKGLPNKEAPQKKVKKRGNRST